MITVVLGPPCAGKSSYVRLQAASGDVIVDFDALAAALGSPSAHDAPAAIKSVAHVARFAAINAVLAGIDADAWIIHSSPKAAWLERYSDAGAEVIEIDPGIDVCLDRAREDGRPDWTESAIEQWYADHAEKQAAEGRTKAPMANNRISERGDHPTAGTKDLVVKLKTDGLAEGEFIAYASVFGNKDSYGDVVIKGAFTNTLAEWERKGVPIPLLWGHNTADPDFNLGEVVEATEDERGLKVHCRLDLDSPKSAQTYRLLKSGRVNQMSFAYGIVDGAYIEPEGEGKSWRDAYYELRELDLYEVSIVPIGANQETEILAVKSVVGSLSAKAVRSLSTKSEDAIRGVITQAEQIVSALKGVLPEDISDGADEQEDQDQTTGEEPSSETEKSSDATTPSPSVSLALMELETLAQGDVEL